MRFSGPCADERKRKSDSGPFQTREENQRPQNHQTPSPNKLANRAASLRLATVYEKYFSPNS
jgi:hypothetical protein